MSLEHIPWARSQYLCASSDIAIPYDNETWVNLQGVPGMCVWTDSWAKRGDRWQIVSAHDLVVINVAPPVETPKYVIHDELPVVLA